MGQKNRHFDAISVFIFEKGHPKPAENSLEVTEVTNNTNSIKSREFEQKKVSADTRYNMGAT